MFPRSRFGASICHPSSLLVSARVFDEFRGISYFVIFNVTRVVLETLPNHAQLVACLSQRAAVKSRHTQQRFVLWLRRLHELANPWKRFKSLVIFLNQCFTEFVSHPYPCRVPWCFASARPCLVSRLCEAVFSLMQIPRETLLHKSRSVVKFCDILSIHCFQLARVVSACFSSVPWFRCLCTHPT